MTRILPFGDRGLLVEVDDLDAVLALREALAARIPAGVVDLVPAARTVLVVIDPTRMPLPAARSWIAGAAARAPRERQPAREVDVPVVYEGEDLAETARVLGVSPDALVARHAAAVWTVAFTGFAPGFGYLISPQWAFEVPRRPSPRARVPAGAVALAGAFSGAYPRATPGGWQLIGSTSAPLFDPAAAEPVLLAPGTQVRFVPVRAAVDAGAVAGSAVPAGPLDSSAEGALGILDAGMRSTVQDQGRPGHIAEGVAASGAADRSALRLGNRLLGNDEDAAGIEITLGGFRARVQRDLWFALTGAWGPARVGGRAVDPGIAHPWPAGEVLEVDTFTHGVRGYLALRGGIDAARVFGSAATDTLSGLGPPPLTAGDTLEVGDAATAPIPPEDLHPWGPPEDRELRVAVRPGPRADWFADAAVLFETVWAVSAQADRVGIRLEGPALVRRSAGGAPGEPGGEVPRELPSEGMLPGAIQVPPDGQPVILGPDGPVTGGYPVIAVVADASCDALAQARPGTRIRFHHAR